MPENQVTKPPQSLSPGSFSATRLLIFRHGEVDAGEKRPVFYSQTDIPLSKRGVEQALFWPKALKGLRVDLVLSSDLSRCLFQAEALRKVWGCDLEVSKALREVDFGKWTGLAWEEIEAAYPGQLKMRMADLESFRPPEGESLGDLRRRAMSFLKKRIREYKGGCIALVAHGGINRVIIATLIGLPLQHIFSLGQDFGCLSSLDIFSDGPVVLRYLNVTTWIRSDACDAGEFP